MRVKRTNQEAANHRICRIAAVVCTVVVLLSAQATTRGADGSQAVVSGRKKANPTTHPTAEVLVEKSIRIPMRDGVHLVADVFRPTHAGSSNATDRVPVILARTPYGRHLEGTLYGQFFAKHGYAFVAQDVRGRFESEGEWTPFLHERDDGADSIGWLAKQPWCNGDVAMFGASYGAMCAWYAATSGQPQLRAVIAMVNVADPDQFMPFTGGVFHIGFAGWAKMLEAMEGPGGMASVPRFDWEKAVRVRPLSELDRFFQTRHTYVDDVLEHPLSDRNYWNRIGYVDKLSKASVAGLHITGWFDVHRAGTFSAYDRLREHAATPEAREAQYLLVGPWAHLGVNRLRKLGSADFGADAITDLNETMVRFLDRHLKRSQNGFGDDGRVRRFVLGENQWRVSNDWPPSDARAVTLNLASSGMANLRSDGGTLSVSRGGLAGTEFDEFRYDPDDPPPFLGSMALYPVADHTTDKSTLSDRIDVLDYRSGKLAVFAEVVGPVEVVLFVSTSASDTDLAAELFRVTPTGGMFRLTGGIHRLRYRHGYDEDAPVEPGQVVKLVIRCPPIACRLEPGDRLHLQIGSAAIPAYAPHLNTLDPIATAKDSVIATSCVWHSARRQSYVALSVRAEEANLSENLFLRAPVASERKHPE